MKHIYFMRHGETDLNKNNCLQGQFDEPLNEEGIRQAEETGEKLRQVGVRFDRVYSSTLQRAWRTAEVITGLKKEEMILDERIREIDFGIYERMQFGDLSREMWDFFRNPLDIPAPGGMENLKHLGKRTGAFLKDLAADADGTDETWLVSCHGIAMRSILSNLTDTSWMDAWKLPIENCSVYETFLEDGEYTKGVRVELPELK